LLPRTSSADKKSAAGNADKKLAARIPPVPAKGPKKCRVWTASYGGQKAVLIKSETAEYTNYTVLDVNAGKEKREAAAYIAAYAKGGETLEDFSSTTKALSKAFKLCPTG
jgi:hypothetical protein